MVLECFLDRWRHCCCCWLCRRRRRVRFRVNNIDIVRPHRILYATGISTRHALPSTCIIGFPSMRSAGCILSQPSILLLITLVHLLLLLPPPCPPLACVLCMSFSQWRSQYNQQLLFCYLFLRKTTYGMTKACAELVVNDCARYVTLSFIFGGS